MCFYYAIVKKNAATLIKNEVVNEDQLSLFDDNFYTGGFDHDKLPVITNDNPDEVQLFEWGLIPSWVKDSEKAKEMQSYTLNAKSETIFEKPSFKQSIKEKRCLILCSGFYEWQTIKKGKKKIKIPHYISLKDDELFVFAGIWDSWTDKETGEIHKTYSLITTEANELMSEIHNEKKRMPLILPPELANDWLDNSLNEEEIKSFFKPFESGKMKAHTISKLISKRDADKDIADIQAYYHYPELRDEIEGTLF
jgi:putative SOS response-associated peptidase YedK